MEPGESTVFDAETGDGKCVPVLVAPLRSQLHLGAAVAMNTKLVAVVLVVALVATGISTGLAVILSR